jgi:hypothetical protein
MLWVCFAAGRTGAFHKRMENYVDILKQHLKTSVRKFGHKWVFQMDNDPQAYFQQSQGIGEALTSIL